MGGRSESHPRAEANPTPRAEVNPTPRVEVNRTHGGSESHPAGGSESHPAGESESHPAGGSESHPRQWVDKFHMLPTWSVDTVEIPPTKVGGWFSSNLCLAVNESSPNCRWWDSSAAG